MKAYFAVVLVVVISAVAILIGTQTLTGYYADPSGYGYDDAEFAFTEVSVGITVMAAAALAAGVRTVTGSI
jgi:hypothetical protein